MPEYAIERWDPIIVEGNDFPYPTIYIKPDPEFEKYSTENGGMFMLEIKGTGMDYDVAPSVGVVNPSAFFPLYRPNFFNRTGYWTITLMTNWIGYPEQTGKVVLRGVKGSDRIIPKQREFQVPKPIEWFEQPKNTDDKLKMKQVALVMLTILLIFGGFALAA